MSAYSLIPEICPACEIALKDATCPGCKNFFGKAKKKKVKDKEKLVYAEIERLRRHDHYLGEPCKTSPERRP